MKFSDIISTANHNLLRNKTRSFLTILAVFIGSFTIIMSNAINTGVNDFIDKQMESVGGDGYLEMMPAEAYESVMSMMGGNGVSEYTETKDAASNTTYIHPEVIARARAIDGMKSFYPISSTAVDYITSDYTNKLYRINLNLIVDGINSDMESGVAPSTREGAPYELALTNDYVDVLGFGSAEEAVGKKVYLAVPNSIKCYTSARHSDCQTMITATVSGVQAPGILSMGGVRANMSLWNRIHEVNVAGMPKESANRPFEAVAEVEPARRDEIKEELKELGLIAMSIDDEAGMIRTFLDAVLVVLSIFGGIALLAAAIGIINTLFMSVQERTREIGLMKAMGMSNGKIFLSFSMEAIMLGFWGSAVGIIFSMAIGFAMDTAAHASILKDFPTFNLVVFDPVNMITIALVIMLIAFIAGTAPAYRAAKKNPIDSLRYE